MYQQSTFRDGTAKPDREECLRRIVDAWRRVPFEWGHHDCVLFAARCVDAQCGSDFEKRIRAEFRYDTALEALRLVKDNGGFEGVVTRFLGPAVPVEQLEFGDVVLGRGPAQFADTIALGVHDDDHFMVPDNQRLAWLPMKFAIKGWKCPLPEVL